MSKKVKLHKKILLSCFSFVVMFFIIELSIRCYDVYNGKGFFTIHRNQVKSMKRMIPFRGFGHTLYEQKSDELYIVSRHGELYPFVKKENSFRIVTLGGSTTENMMTQRRLKGNYPSVLEQKLQEAATKKNVEVINVGYRGYSSAHSLILLELHVLNWQPDLIIVSHNINDLLASYWPKFDIDYSNKYEHEAHIPPIPMSLDILLQHFQIYWITKEVLGKYQLQNTTFPVRRKSLGVAPSDLACNVFKRNLTSIITLAKKNKIQVILGSQPLEKSEEYFIKHIQYKSYNQIVYYPLHEELIQHHEKFNQIIADISKDEEVFFVDNASIFAGENGYFLDFVHYSKRGVHKLAINYSKFILKNDIIK